MKKFLTLLLTTTLTATLAITGTIAYLTDTDSDVNVMTLGSVRIEQLEQERVDTSKLPTEPGNLKPYVDKALYPAVYEGISPGASIPWNAASEADQPWKVVAYGADKNVADKFVTVKNTGKSEAYIRTIIAYEGDVVSGKDIHIVTNGSNLTPALAVEYIENVVVNGVRYDIGIYTYPEALKPGETSVPSLKQVYMDKGCTNEDVAKYGETYDILVLSQAVQSAGFAGPEAALNEAFGKVTAAKAAEWFGSMTIPTIVTLKYDSAKSTAENGAALEAAIIAASGSTIIRPGEGTYAIDIAIPADKDITIEGTADTVLTGRITAETDGKLHLRDLTFNPYDTASGAGITVSGPHKVICENVIFNCSGQNPIWSDTGLTIEGCTFNDPYKYAVQLTSGAAIEEAEVIFRNNIINGGPGGKNVVCGIQLEGENYGCRNLTINGSGNKITIHSTEVGAAMYYCQCGKVDHDTITWNTEVRPVHQE